MKYISIIGFTLFLFSCDKNYTHVAQCKEFRNNNLFQVIERIDKIAYLKKDLIEYTTAIKQDKNYKNQWIFDLGLNISEKTYYDYKGQSYISQLLDVKEILIKNNSFKVYQFLIDRVGAEDDMSLKFYTSEYGVILERYWRNNYLITSKINNKESQELNALMNTILNEQSFNIYKLSKK